MISGVLANPPRRASRPKALYRLNRFSPHANGLIAWWPTRAQEGLTHRWPDESGYSHHGTLGVNNLFSSDVNFGFGMRFDGTNSDVVVSTTSLLSSPRISITAWISVRGGAGGFRQIANKPASAGWSSPYADYCLRLNTSDQLQGWISNAANAVSGSTAISADNSWHHVALTYDGATTTLYLDGKSDGSTGAATGDIAASGQPLQIGRLNTGVAEWWNGDMADLRIYRRSLTAAEIKHQYDPQTRWDLYYPEVGRVVPVDSTAAAAGGARSQIIIIG